MTHLQPSSNCINLVKQFEGLRLEAYLDTGRVPTIGWGHTANVSMGPPPDLIGEDQAEALLNADLQAAALTVNNLVKFQPTQNQFDALVDFEFNEGRGHLETSTLLHLFNLGAIEEAANQFGHWVYGSVNGTDAVLQDLVERRAAEKALFLTA